MVIHYKLINQLIGGTYRTRLYHAAAIIHGAELGFPSQSNDIESIKISYVHN